MMSHNMAILGFEMAMHAAVEFAVMKCPLKFIATLPRGQRTYTTK